MTRLAGFTARVTEIMTVLDDLNKGHYVRSMLTDNNTLNEKKNWCQTPDVSLPRTT